MADNPDKPTPVADPGTTLKLAADASAHAPFLYFEDATAFGVANGVVRITLEACRLLSTGGSGVEHDRVVIAHLRMNVAAARSLKAAIDGVLLMLEPPTSRVQN